MTAAGGRRGVTIIGGVLRYLPGHQIAPGRHPVHDPGEGRSGRWRVARQHLSGLLAFTVGDEFQGSYPTVGKAIDDVTEYFLVGSFASWILALGGLALAQ